MGRFTGSLWKKSRRLGVSLTGTGKELSKRPYAPGQHGNTRRKASEYGLQLQEKQKLRFMYGVNERQFYTLFEKSGKIKGVHGETFLIVLDSLLYNLVYFACFVRILRQSRHLVNHVHITFHVKRVDIPSYRVNTGQVIRICEQALNMDVIKLALEVNTFTPDYLTVDPEKMEATFTRTQERSELPAEINEALVV